MAPITNLFAKYAYPANATGLPIVVVMHGWSQKADDLTSATLQRMADYGVFAVAVGMRGRDSASGTADASAREIYDIYDAIEYIKTNYSDIVDPTHICICGYSGGGGNALAFACKIPDYAQYIVSCFGIADYGVDGTDGWYYSGAPEGGYQSSIEARIGGDPTEAPDAYAARDAVSAIANYTSGHLWLFHDDEDVTVPIVNSQRIGAAMLAAGLSNYTESYTASEDNPRWLHGLPNSGPIIQTEPIWLQAVADKSIAAWTVPTTGTVTVIGYIATKRFSIWLGDGTEDVATVAYNTGTGQYTVTPLTGSMDVVITQGELTASQTISSETTLTVT